MIGIKHKVFIEIGSSDGLNSNCANLAINFGWHGLFIDGDKRAIKRGQEFYNKHPKTWLYPPKFVSAIVTAENINDIINESGINNPVDLMSIDIDGNDYWVWDAITSIKPSVVVIETHIEFGLKPIVVPYDPLYTYPGKHPQYHGASIVAMTKLAKEKGYVLVASNLYGFNTIFVRKEIAKGKLHEITPKQVLANHPRNKDRESLFEEIKNYKYTKI